MQNKQESATITILWEAFCELFDTLAPWRIDVE